jgi:hypothetical protein
MSDTAAVKAPQEKSPAAKEEPKYQPSDTVKRTQKILESIEQRKEERARLVGEIKMREVQVDGIDRGLEGLRKNLEAELVKLDAGLARKGA